MKAFIGDDGELNIETENAKEVKALETFAHKGMNYGYYHAASGFGAGGGMLLIAADSPVHGNHSKVKRSK
jgi:hypothetical protein